MERLNPIPGISCFSPHGTFYAFPDVSRLLDQTFRGKKIHNTLELSEYLLDSEGVAVVPGGAFEGERHLRLSFAGSMEVIQSGINPLHDDL